MRLITPPSIKLYKGDCFDYMKQLPSGSVDCVIMDPPYLKKGAGYYRGGGCFGTDHRAYHKELDDNSLLGGCSVSVLKELVRVMKKVNIYIWCNKEQLHQYIHFFLIIL